MRLAASLGRTEKRTIDISNIPKCSPIGTFYEFHNSTQFLVQVYTDPIQTINPP